ncbi:MAG: hypothetical protein ACI9DC_000880 [Gammaproteobacteria bacterium]|jgi:hypothetical protein
MRNTEDSTRLLLVGENRGDYILTREMLQDINCWRFSLD